ncbi:hypothetical protein V3481_006191 [Fusarium oxysporum f. sp. vasinfectum]|uniref:Secreted protein n=1 Tax=Fusarium oxysporum f. sp. vasinfectum 25433 TaxID=1089449 RepID=X0KWD3_FUSOX|nr:hypothetical protein FOTG_13987 [Fusarium oxysporum f. sp. vasinfectum 25433]
MNSLSLIVLFFGAAMAGIHHNCGCTVRGSYRQDLAQAACALWGSNQPHTHWDGYSISTQTQAHRARKLIM